MPEGLIDVSLSQGYVEEEDVRLPVQVETVDEAVAIILRTLDEFRSRPQSPVREGS